KTLASSVSDARPIARRRLLALATLSLAALAAPRPAAAQTGWRVGLQAGHWRAAELPDELRRLRTATGTYGGGVNEWELNLDVARRAARRLEAEGVAVDVLPATVPPGYQADAFVAIHADGDASGCFSGFKLARARRSAIPDEDDRLLGAVAESYAAATGLPLDPRVSRAMTGYYAFSSRRFTHAIAPTTPAVIIEMGFMTSYTDLNVLLNRTDALAAGISRGVYRFLEQRGG
ncbi:MAG TPA: N-acetylmuramoyl-L-alanine amidase, partial [Chloroflexota bacterium]|nr:N-acetylmuramoyl-L-alanine amidase [Chloroflexota bacterium]